MSAIDIMPIIAAGLVPFLAGFVWYHPRVFGRYWMSSRQITPQMVERNAERSSKSALTIVVLGICSAIVLRTVLFAMNPSSYFELFVLVASLWIAFVVPATISTVLLDHRPIRVYAIEAGKWLVTLLIMSRVLLL